MQWINQVFRLKKKIIHNFCLTHNLSFLLQKQINREYANHRYAQWWSDQVYFYTLFFTVGHMLYCINQ